MRTPTVCRPVQAPVPRRRRLAVCPSAPGIRDHLAGLVTFVDGEHDETIDPGKRARLADLFGITPEEVAVVGEDRFRDLVIERVALLDVYR